MTDKERLEFKDLQIFIKSEFGTEKWLTIYKYSKQDYEIVDIYCALIPPKIEIKVFANVNRDLSFEQGMPVNSFSETLNKNTYLRFGNYEGIEPLVFYRSFYEIKKPYLEISEEFRHFFNLYQDKSTGNLIYIDNNGDEEEVVRMKEDEIQINLPFIKNYLNIKNMYLAVYFEVRRFADSPLNELGLKSDQRTYKDSNYIYMISIDKKHPSLVEDKWNSFAQLLGKKIIKGDGYKTNETEKKFVDFIIGVDENGNEITHTCNEDNLSNHFGKNAGAPNYLTPVFFKKEVLGKYYSNPSKYYVKDGYLGCGSLWSLGIDNNHEKYVIVYLGDLGHLLYKEQIYWKSFNIPPDGTISITKFKRDIMAESADSERSDLYFKDKFIYFQQEWEKKFGWHLFLPLSQEDEHHFKTLRIPLNNEQKEFDGQVLSLTKILIDSLNEEKLATRLPIKKDAKGIDKLEVFLKSKNIKFLEMIEFLRNLQRLRSTGVAHLKGKNYDKVKKEFGIGEKEFPEIFDEILKYSIMVLNSLENKFLKVE